MRYHRIGERLYAALLISIIDFLLPVTTAAGLGPRTTTCTIYANADKSTRTARLRADYRGIDYHALRCARGRSGVSYT
ncbi:hypothetical protein [Burkholderia multivorans]|uniref:hypothetical protein n=1 Tax=Burkholderia multivorans TaxID=87883 RepID=UPI0015E331CF|nr:hypothetical protein [Burkholderia multivorans]